MAILAVDLSSAFDLVNRSILMPKLSRMGYTPRALELMEMFMRNKQLKTKIGSSFSEFIDVDIGSPQGGITSPSAYNLLCADYDVTSQIIASHQNAPTGTEVDSETYADDSATVLAADDFTDLQKLINLAYPELIKYFSCQSLFINKTKTELIVFNPDRNFIIEGTSVKNKSTMKLLGVRFCDKFTFKPQVDHVISKLQALVPCLNKLIKWAPLKITAKTLETFGLNIIRYCCEIWLQDKSYQALIQRQYNILLRVCTNGNAYTPIKEMLSTLSLPNIHNIVLFQTIIFLHKIYKYGHKHVFMSKSFGFSHNKYNTRWRRLEPTYTHTTTPSKLSFVPKACQYYTELGLVGKINTDADFRQELPELIISRFGNDNL